MMTELLIFAIFFVFLALLLFLRIIKGPNAVDRALTADAIEILLTTALMLYAVYSGRSGYLDIALVVALLGFIGTVLIARYIGGRL